MFVCLLVCVCVCLCVCVRGGGGGRYFRAKTSSITVGWRSQPGGSQQSLRALEPVYFSHAFACICTHQPTHTHTPIHILRAFMLHPATSYLETYTQAPMYIRIPTAPTQPYTRHIYADTNCTHARHTHTHTHTQHLPRARAHVGQKFDLSCKPS